MHFSTSVRYPAPAEEVSTLWREEAFQRAKAERAGARRSSISIKGDDELTITIRTEVPSDEVPQAARRFIGSTLQVTIVEVWQAPNAEGKRVGTLSLDIAGAPVRVRARMELLPLSDSCTKTYDGDVTASVPLFSKPIEKAAVGAVDDIVAAEKAIVVDFLKRP